MAKNVFRERVRRIRNQATALECYRRLLIRDQQKACSSTLDSLGVAAEYDYVPHIRRIGEEKLDEEKRKKYPARRWVVGRRLGWLSKCRTILVRYAKLSWVYLGLIKLACILLWYRHLHRLKTVLR